MKDLITNEAVLMLKNDELNEKVKKIKETFSLYLPIESYLLDVIFDPEDGSKVFNITALTKIELTRALDILECFCQDNEIDSNIILDVSILEC